MAAPCTDATRVVLYDSRRLVREGMAAFLEHDGLVVEQCEVPGEFAEKVQSDPDAIVINIDGADDALWSVCERSRRRLQRARSIGVVNECDAITARRVQRLGLARVVTCDAGLRGVVDALRATPPPIRRAQIRRRRPDAAFATIPLRLTPRELAVLRQISLGLTAQQIAQELHITAKTVENHKQRIYRKLGVQSQSQAVGVALRRGLLQAALPFAASNIG